MLKDIFYNHIVYDEDQVDCDEDRELTNVEKEYGIGYVNVAQELLDNYHCYTIAQIFNTVGKDILGKDKAHKFKELYDNERYDKEYFKLLNEMIDIIEDAYEEVIRTNNGIIINFYGGQISFDEDENCLKWKYELDSNGDFIEDENRYFILTKDYANCVIDEKTLNLWL